MIYYYIAAYVVMGLLTSAITYLIEEDEWKDNEIGFLIPMGLFWPLSLTFIVLCYALQHLETLRKRIHRKKETLSKENMPSSPPKAGTLWEEEKEEKKKYPSRLPLSAHHRR